jgi:hypothetical protein
MAPAKRECWDDCGVLMMIIEMLDRGQIEKAKAELRKIIKRRAPDREGAR